MLRSVEEVLKIVGQAAQPPKPLLKVLQCYHYFVQQPFGDIAKPISVLDKLEIAELGKPDEPEIRVLLTHLVELLWYRSSNDGTWLRVVDSWIQRSPPELKSLFQSLRARLFLQTRLISPNGTFPVVNPADLETIHKDLALSRLWLFTLWQDGPELDRELERLNSNMSAEFHIARLVFDFHHRNRFFGGWGDPQEVGLTRRWLFTSSSPLLTFTEMREARLSRTLGQLFRRNEAGQATDRFHCFSLAMLCEVAALRAWDWVAWGKAVRSQSEAFLEVSRWESMPEGFSAQAVRLAVQSLSYKTKRDDALTRNAISRLEFASQQTLLELTESLLITYPLQRRGVFEIFQDLSDLLPMELWPRLAKWTAEYATQLEQHRHFNSPGVLLSFWIEMFPFAEKGSEVWEILLPVVFSEVRKLVAWSSEGCKVLTAWLLYAPIEFAKQLGNVVLSLEPVDLAVGGERLRILTAANEGRPELGLDLGSCAPARRVMGPSGESDTPPSKAGDAEKALYKGELLNFMKTAVVTLPAGPFDFAYISSEPINRFTWNEDDLPLVTQLVDTIENPKVFTNHLISLLDCLQTLVAKGPESYARSVLPHFGKWVENRPKGIDPTEQMKGPFATLRFTHSLQSNVQEGLGTVGFQLFWRLRTSSVQVIALWLQQSVLSPESKAVPVMVYTGIPTAAVANDAMRVEIVGACHMLLLHLWTRHKYDQQSGDCLADSLGYLGELFQGQVNSLIDWKASAGQQTLQLTLSKFSPLLCECGNSHHPDVRAALARMLKSIRNWTELPARFQVILSKLLSDNRARVRAACRS